jgi:hypothetical protein
LLAQQLTDYTTNPTVLDRRKLMEWNHRFAKYNDDYNSGKATEDMSIDNTKVTIPTIDDHTCLKTWLNIFKEAIKHRRKIDRKLLAKQKDQQIRINTEKRLEIT